MQLFFFLAQPKKVVQETMAQREASPPGRKSQGTITKCLKKLIKHTKIFHLIDGAFGFTAYNTFTEGEPQWGVNASELSSQRGQQKGLRCHGKHWKGCRGQARSV